MEEILKMIVWVKTWELMPIVYGLVATTIFTFFIRWIGSFNTLNNYYKTHRGIKRYKTKLKEECSSLIVIGRRSGFTLADVYVELDVAKSNLTEPNDSPQISFSESHVLVGGPGAGKSTTVKQMIVKHLDNCETLPFFVRLREYHGYNSIEDYILEKLITAGTPNPHQILANELSKGTLCVLDGLDEIRPQMKAKIYSDINKFYARHFLRRNSYNTLIVSCRKEAYRDIPLDLTEILEVRPLTDQQIQRFADKWPLEYPKEKSKDTFWRDLGAAEKILELARSPLLLVGGLMQYTESNQGIPEERFEYLKRVANWLVIDWATAQGHPPDPNRPVYDRVLAKIAFHMHNSEKSELEMSECVTLLEKWLPTFGRSESEATNIIDSISTKTGILVREGGNNIVFAQFGLQEYFSSLELISTIGIDSIPNLKPITWWREPILLTVAQEREPGTLLQSLFDKSPILAVAAVAECPTPPIITQLKAIEVCLELIDNVTLAVGSATTTLIRKVRDDIEVNFLKKLEERLQTSSTNKKIRSLVGLSLATAGTPKATELLAKYPSLWNTCLKEVSYLSNSFENLLVEWISDGNKEQSKRATDLIIPRLSVDRTLQLVESLPKLNNKIADYLSTSILNALTNSEGQFPSINKHKQIINIICSCTPYTSMNPNEDRKTTGNNNHPITDGYRTLTLKTNSIHKRQPKNPAKLFQLIQNAENWAANRSQLFIFICASTLLSLHIGHNYNLYHSYIPQSLCVLMFLVALAFPTSPPPWMNKLYYGRGGISKIFTNIMIFIIGLLTLYAFGFRGLSTAIIFDKTLYLAPIIMICASYINSNNFRFFHSFSIKSTFKSVVIYSGLALAFLALVSYILEFFRVQLNYIQPTLLALNICYTMLLTLYCIKLYFNWRTIKFAKI